MPTYSSRTTFVELSLLVRSRCASKPVEQEIEISLENRRLTAKTGVAGTLGHVCQEFVTNITTLNFTILLALISGL